MFFISKLHKNQFINHARNAKNNIKTTKNRKLFYLIMHNPKQSFPISSGLISFKFLQEYIYDPILAFKKQK